MQMFTIHPTPEETTILRSLSRATGPDFKAGFISGDGGVAFTADDRDGLVEGLCVMPQLGHDSKTVHNLIHRILKAEA